jgi:hypothetical protein
VTARKPTYFVAPQRGSTASTCPADIALRFTSRRSWIFEVYFDPALPGASD